MRSLAGDRRTWLWRVPLVLGGVGLLVLPLPGTAAATTPAARGNKKAIAFERAAYKVDNATAAYVERLVGYVTYRTQPTPNGTLEFSLDWGTPVAQPGWAPATVTIVWGLQYGRVAWMAAKLTPPPGNPNKVAHLIVDSSGARWSVTTPTRDPGGCYTTATATFSSQWSSVLGKPLFTLSGNFKRPPKTKKVHGRSETFVTYTSSAYSYDQHVTETDVFNAKTKAAVRSLVKYAAKGTAHPAFTVHQTWHPKASAAEPVAGACAATG